MKEGHLVGALLESRISVIDIIRNVRASGRIAFRLI